MTIEYEIFVITNTRHDYREIARNERNKIYKCKKCGNIIKGNLEQVTCGLDCQDSIHFCKESVEDYFNSVHNT